MKLLFLGGTRFVGKAMVLEALERGHEVTLFNRGNHPLPSVQAEQLTGDRDGGLQALEGRTWDAVIDTSGYLPRVVRESVKLLQGHVGHYTFISTLDVYEHPLPAGIDETHPVKPLKDESLENIQEAYGELKGRCEEIVQEVMGGRALIVRCGLVIGPGDPSGRFTYWPSRIAQGGQVLAPGNPNAPIQFIDARDLAGFVISRVEAGGTGVYNATGPLLPVTVSEVLQTCKETLDSDASFTWVSDEFLLDHNVTPWMEMPLWLPEKDNIHGLMALSIGKAVGDGLTFRPLSATIRDTLDSERTRGRSEPPKAGMEAGKERELLEKWKFNSQ